MSKMQRLRVCAAVVATLCAAVGGSQAFASPALAASDQATSGPGDALYAAPDGVQQDDWQQAMSVASSAHGRGDAAYVEAALSVSPMSITYCNDRWNRITSIGTYRYPVYLVASGPGTTMEVCVLESGLNNRGVSTLQNALNKCYGRNLVVDGAFGSATHAALIQAQRSHGITADGVYGPQTRSVLRFPNGSGNGCRTIASINSLPG